MQTVEDLIHSALATPANFFEASALNELNQLLDKDLQLNPRSVACFDNILLAKSADLDTNYLQTLQFYTSKRQ